MVKVSQTTNVANKAEDKPVLTTLLYLLLPFKKEKE